MIKFKSIFIIIGFFMSYYFQGQNISEETARMVANNFLNLKSENKRSLEVQLTNITAQINKKYNGFYIFKTANGQEFCIISSEKGNHPVLAYSFDSPLSTNGPISPEFLYILDGYQAANEYLRKNKSKKIINEDNALIKKEWEALLDGNSFSSNKKAKISQPEKVEPLLKTTWNQSTSKYIPRTYENLYCPTGCVATAMAQIMKYWNYPVKGKGIHTYTIPNYFYDWKGKTLTADFENTTYLWDTMPYSSSSSTEAEKDAVDILKFHAGVAVDMMYGPGGSGAYNEAVAPALVNYFNYSKDISLEYRRYYSNDTEWLNLIKDQLAKGYPLYFSGFDSDKKGHALVADGYDANNLIHFNFGWGGSANGYYQITNPGGYSDSQAVVINIYPSASTCSTPTGLSSSNILDCSAILSWKVVNGAQNYTIEYKTAFASTWTIANAANNSNSFTLSGLVANTAYNWRVRANCPGSNTSDYSQANLKTMLPAPCIANYEPNDSFAQATAINTNTNYSAGIGSSADKDYYKFTLNSKSIVTVTLQNLSKNYDLIIYNSSQGQIGKSALGGTSNESITLNNLEPGTYYVHVYGYNGNFDITQCYNLKVEAIALAAPCIANYEPNDSFAQATAINTNTNYSAGIGSSADKDYYKFTLNSKSNVTVTLQNLPKNYELIVYNSSNAQIGKSTNGGNTNESITLNYLDPGTYYVMVYGYNGYFDITQCYNLKIEAAVIAPCIANYEPNDSFAQATAINTNTNYSAGIGTTTDKDYYKFTLYNWSNINVTLKDLPKDYNLVVYNSSKAQIAKSVNGGFTNESVTLNYLEPGTYYVVVEGYNGNYDINRCYTLKAEATAIASCVANYEPNDSFAQATAINNNTNYSAGIGTITDKDYYKFTLNNWSNINVTLKDLPKDYNLVLYNSSKAQIAKSVNGGTTNESVTLNYLEPGTYYVVVEGYNGNFDITQCYTLKAEATAIASCVANYEPNDSFAQATSIQSNIDYSAGIGSASDKDYYNFILNSKSNVTVTLQNLPKDYNFIIFNSSYKKIGKSTRKKKLNKLVFSKTLKPDTYYMQVYGEKGDFDINQCYTLKVEGNYITYKNVNTSDTQLDNKIPNTENNTSVILYPNPVEDIINIKGIYSDKNEHTNLTIYDRNGRIVKSFFIRIDNIISINVSDLSPNVYYLNIKGKNYKFIKK